MHEFWEHELISALVAILNYKMPRMHEFNDLKLLVHYLQFTIILNYNMPRMHEFWEHELISALVAILNYNMPRMHEFNDPKLLVH